MPVKEAVQLAVKEGVAGVYRWTHGEQSLMAKQSEAVTWKDIGLADPISGCHKLIEGLQKIQDVLGATKG